MYLAKKKDDPDRVRPPQRGNDERRNRAKERKEKKSRHKITKLQNYNFQIFSFKFMKKVYFGISY